jgi:hypothetical protein
MMRKIDHTSGISIHFPGLDMREKLEIAANNNNGLRGHVAVRIEQYLFRRN